MKIGSITAILFYFVAAIFWQSSAVLACSCIVMPRAEVYKGSDVVVVGRVVDVRVVGKLRHARVEVSKTIKGSKTSSGIIDFVTKLDDAQCGYRFKVRDKPITIAANSQANGTPFVNNCMMYSLKRADRADRKAAKKAGKTDVTQKAAESTKAELAKKVSKITKAAEPKMPEAKIVTTSCLAKSKTGSAACDAICPSGRTVLSCAQNVGRFASDDTCTSLSNMFSGPAGANGKFGAQPNDRCRVSATCSFKKQKLSAQAWAICVHP